MYGIFILKNVTHSSKQAMAPIQGTLMSIGKSANVFAFV